MANLRSHQLCVELIRRKILDIEQQLSLELREKLQRPSQTLQDRIDFVMSAIEHAFSFAGLKDRLEAQQATLSNLITQGDSLLSVSIAQDSREIAAASERDSSSMKIIAVLTTFFLPGTFAATFFSMPVLDWSKSSINDVANRHFWVFWAVAVPLTLTVMAGVATWAFWNGHRTRLSDLRARDAVAQPQDKHMKDPASPNGETVV